MADFDRVASAGVIPACAGSTYDGKRYESRIRGHPRMRGEHLLILHYVIS